MVFSYSSLSRLKLRGNLFLELFWINKGTTELDYPTLQLLVE